MRAMIAEGQAVAAACGSPMDFDPGQRAGSFADMPDFKTSMLQDLEAGRTIELDPLLGAVIELGQRHGVDVATCRLIYHLTRERARAAGCYVESGAPQALTGAT
jgi:2-dehydropantoate 2-reductase